MYLSLVILTLQIKQRIVFLSAVLAGATIYYAVETHKMNKASEKTQKLVEEQNSIMATHNQSLKDQADVHRNLVGVLSDLSLKMVFIANAITDLPYDAQEIKNKKEKKSG
jgi:F0F1-type ATP synthase membrane subunit a